MLEEVFIPNEEKMEEIVTKVREKFEFIEGIKTSITDLEDILSGLEPAPSLSINIGETKYTNARTVKIIDLSWYAPFKGIGDAVLTGFIYISFLWSLFIHAPGFFSGASGAVDTITKFKG